MSDIPNEDDSTVVETNEEAARKKIIKKITKAQGRTCDICGKPLSVYNTSNLCFAHKRLRFEGRAVNGSLADELEPKAERSRRLEEEERTRKHIKLKKDEAQND